VDRVRAHYQRQGHYDVQVDVRETRGEGTLELAFDVEPGPAYTLAEIRFTGNESFAAGKLGALLETSEKSLFTLGSGRLVDETLSLDLANVRSFYALQGFGRVKVGPVRVERRGRDLVLTVPIDEGPRQRVAGLAFAGVAALEVGRLAREIPLEAGGPFHPRLLEDSLNLVRAAYEREGYGDAQVSAATGWNDDRTLVDVTVQVLEGPRTVVDRVIVRGNQATAEAVVVRAADLAGGEPVSAGRLLEVERRLYRLGIFSRVDVALTPAPLGATTRDVLVRVEEGDVRKVTYGFGYDTEDGPGGLGSYTHGNLFGRAWSATADARVRQNRQQYRLLVDQPYFPGIGLPVTYSIFRLEEDRETFELTKWGTRVDLVNTVGRTRLALGYDYRLVENRLKADLPPDAGAEDVRREDQTLRISSLVPNLQVDRRDDPLDPSRGWHSVVQLQVSFPFLNAEADFVKLFAQQTQVLSLGRAGVVAASARLGGIEPLGTLDLDDLLVPGELPNAEVFIAERFFAGGASTNRGYERDRLGLPDRTLFADAAGRLVPAGGNGLFLLNLDYRFPIAGAVGGEVFFDTGNVWADWRDLRWRDLRSGAGVGVRYLSPIGPVRLEIGWPLDRLADDDRYVVFLSLGNAF
jgi:outer membrane protein insertion porin family